MADIATIHYMLEQIATMEDFIKLSTLDGKISLDCAGELLRLTREVSETGLRTRK